MTEAAAATTVRPTERERGYRRAGTNKAACDPIENMLRSAAVAAREFDCQGALATALLGEEVAAAAAASEEEAQTSVIRTNRGILLAENEVLRAGLPALKLLPGQARRRKKRGNCLRTRENADGHPCTRTAAAAAAATATAVEAICSARKRETTQKVRKVRKACKRPQHPRPTGQEPAAAAVAASAVAMAAVVLPVLVLPVVVPQRPKVEAQARETSAQMLHPPTLANASANDHGAPHKNILRSRPARLKRMPPPPPESEEGRGARARMPPQTNGT